MKQFSLKKQVLFWLVVFAQTLPLFAQTNQIYVQDPRNGWARTTPRVEYANFEVRPRGAYAEVTLQMGYSPNGTFYTRPTDTVELVHFFSLPSDVLINDSWLWVDSTIVYGKLIDRWTASRIYEGIVNRRRDPSILFKNSATDYEFRIFPMASGQTRKVQLSFLIPFKYSANSANALFPNSPIVDLPIHLVRGGNLMPPVSVYFFPENGNTAPNFVNIASGAQTWAARTDPASQRPFYHTTIAANIANTTPFTLVCNTPIKPVSMQLTQFNNEKYYELAINSQLVRDSLQVKQKKLFLIDYEQINWLTKDDLLVSIKRAIRTTIFPSDSFAILLTRTTQPLFSNKWFSGNVLDSVLNALTVNHIQQISDVRAILLEGVNFIKNNNGGDIVLFSNDIFMGTLVRGNACITELMNIMNPLPNINIFDYNRQYSSNFINNTNYNGNGYLYTILTAQTQGALLQAPYYSTLTQFEQSLTTFMNQSARIFENIDINVSASNGFTYARFNATNIQNSLNIPITQYGKYVGQPPFRVEITGFYRNRPFSQVFHVADTMARNGAGSIRQMWVGKQIETWQNTTPTNQTVTNIINLSMRNLVLSQYTAFLALEPSMGGDTCYVCRNNNASGSPVSTKEEENMKIELKAFPNPFDDKITFNATFPAWEQGQAHDITIYNVMGQAVHKINLALNNGDTKIEVNWEAIDLPKGVYIAQLNIGKLRKIVKIIKN